MDEGRIAEDGFEALSNENPISLNEYPDLDYVPNYPWLGEHIALDDNRPLPYVQPTSTDNAIEDSQDDASRQGSPSKGLTATDGSPNAYFLPSDGRDPKNPSLDPDFQLSEEGTVSDEYLSGGDSDDQSVDDQGSLSCLVGEIEEGRSDGQRLRIRARRGGGERGRGCHGHGQRGGGKGVKRGQRKPLEPSVEFKMLHSQATMAFIDHDYEEAEQLALQAILVNPEMYTARFLLSEIHMARGDKDKAITALFHAAHTQPRDTKGWHKLAQLLLERDREDRPSALRDAIYCYSRIVSLEPTNAEARYQRATLNRELGYAGRAAQEYEHLLKQLPHDTTVLRHLAEIYIELNDVDKAVAHYDESIAYYREKEPFTVTSFSWSDVNICAELYGYQSYYEKASLKLKALSRWLLGRGTDSIWENFEGDDREWDSEDLPRRVEVAGFKPGAYRATAYGDGLPLELRVKLGVFRLKAVNGNFEEAINHFEWLDPDDNQLGAKLFDYPDLFREAADALRINCYYHESLSYYEPLQHVQGYTDAAYFADMAACYRAIGMKAEAKDCYQTIVDHDGSDIEAKLNLARLYEEMGMPERAGTHVRDVLSATSRGWKRPGEEGALMQVDTISGLGSPSGTSTMLMPCPPRQALKPRVLEKEIREKALIETALASYLRVQELTEEARNGNVELERQWKMAAASLIRDFKLNRSFYPYDKNTKFVGYSGQLRLGAVKTKGGKTIQEVQSLAGRLQLSSEDRNDNDLGVPKDYLGISFEDWLDIFLEYGLMLARDDDITSAYEILSAAYDANVFFHSPDSMFCIHVCWFTCALIGNDEETLCNIARWFMKEYQFVTDGYRLFSALNRLCDSANTWFNCGPSQKYVLRQLKAMDFSLVGDARSKSHFQERASYTTKDESGNLIQAADMDVALLMLYGHILYAGRSYSYALNYFFRAHALDSTNPIINLSLALAYLHYAIKRQSGNRHHLMIQGFAFLFTYYDLRQRANVMSGKQEAEYNVARAYHMLGLTHLAVPFYQRCLALSHDMKAAGLHSLSEDFGNEAAFSLQGLWAANGNAFEALQVTEEWLVL